jgi:hypothetical protein
MYVFPNHFYTFNNSNIWTPVLHGTSEKVSFKTADTYTKLIKYPCLYTNKTTQYFEALGEWYVDLLPHIRISPALYCDWQEIGNVNGDWDAFQ